MLVLEDKKLGLNFAKIWCWNGEEIHSEANVLRYLRIDPSLAETLKAPKSYDVNHTLITDLMQEEEQIWSMMNKNYKYEIRRAQKEEAEFSVFGAQELADNASVIEEFETAYNAFCDEIQNESVRANYDHAMIMQMIAKNAIVLTKAEQHNLVVYHIYVTDGEVVILDYSVSDFRNEDADKAAAGRLNKLLHWKDMMMFKAEGCKTYDWGNVSGRTADELSGIDRFKAGFGGVLTKQVSVFVGNGVVGNAAVLARKIQNKG